jgi:hypothetical protein
MVFLTGELMAQNVLKGSPSFPASLRLDGLAPPAVSAPGSMPLSGSMPSPPKSYSPAVNPEPAAESWGGSRTPSVACNANKNSLSPFGFPIDSDRPVPAPAGLRIERGLTVSLPVGQGLSTFAGLKPNFKNVFTTPQTMVATGFYVPIVRGTPTSGNLSLKFSTTVDQRFRPVISFTPTTTPFKR